MSREGREIEVKLPFDGPATALDRLAALGARRISERSFEDNVLFDRGHDPLGPRRCMLRLRRCGPRATLTYKAPVEGEHRHKVRVEHESRVEDPDAVERMLLDLGFTPTYRYQKHRTEFSLARLHVSLDETPLGCFVELEGDPEAIDRVASDLGFTAGDYVCESYRDLHLLRARERGEPAGDLVFREAPGS